MELSNEQMPSVGTVSKSNREIVGNGNIDTPNTQLHDRPLSSHGTGTSITILILFRPFGFIAPIPLNYLVFQSFDFERTW